MCQIYTVFSSEAEKTAMDLSPVRKLSPKSKGLHSISAAALRTATATILTATVERTLVQRTVKYIAVKATIVTVEML